MQDDDRRFVREGAIERTDHFFVEHFGVGQVVGDGFSSDRHRAEIEQRFELQHQRLRAAGGLERFDRVGAVRCDGAQHGHFLSEVVEELKHIDVHARLDRGRL